MRLRNKTGLLPQTESKRIPALLAVTEDGEIVFANDSMSEILSLPKIEIIGGELGKLPLAHEFQTLLKHAAADYKGAAVVNGHSYTAYALQVDISAFVGWLFLLQDDTEIEESRKALEEALTLQEELNAAFEGSYDYIFVTDNKGNVLRVNQSYTRITGLTQEEIIGKNIYDLVAQGYFDRAASIEVIESQKPITFSQRHRTGKMVLVTGNPIFDENGELIRVVTNGRDITELDLLKQAVEHAQSLRMHYQQELQRIQREGLGEFIAVSAPMKEIAGLVSRIAKVDSTVLISGESGVGKEIIAREIHAQSLRADKAYISINCAAIPDKLLESELFGYEGGSFTGAQKGGKMGIFQMAHGGTLFLDEIGEMPFYLQAKLLRVLQENEIMRVGGNKPIPVNVRIITATNRDLWQMVQEGQFRQDFYYRLNVVHVRIPPVRERREEIPIFANHFMEQLNKKYKMNKILDPMLVKLLMEYDWPGNVREIRNVIEQAFVSSAHQIITELWLGPQNQEYNRENHNVETTTLKEAMHLYESKLIENALNKYGSTRKAALALGVSQATVWRKTIEYGIKSNEK